ncbi:MAG: aminodeoxychorismate synthase component I [Reichenbachiella sp.]
MISKKEAIAKINSYSANATPFLFVSDYKGEQNLVLTKEQIDNEELIFQINGCKNWDVQPSDLPSAKLTKQPIEEKAYQKKFNLVKSEIEAGNTYLLNLTCQTPVQSDCTLEEVFYQSKAKYKLWFKDEFVVFSPEIFVQIQEGKIASFPMKGTIDADLPDAKHVLLSSEKEMAEHATIVDLIRNDMSVFAKNVEVEKFRYVEEIRTNHKHLLQVSSKITGNLPIDYQSRLGDIIFSLLPAGSITGAPKGKTMKIIEDVEGYERGFYTGVMGYFDGKNFDSGVMIRFIQNEGGKWSYKSGGGIHALSDLQSEYQEMIDKVYVPVY